MKKVANNKVAPALNNTNSNNNNNNNSSSGSSKRRTMAESPHPSSSSSSSSSSASLSSTTSDEGDGHSLQGSVTATGKTPRKTYVHEEKTVNPFYERFVQCKVLTRKNWILSVRRNYAQTIMQIIAPTLCLIALFFIQVGVDTQFTSIDSDPPAVAVPFLEKCIPGTLDGIENCVTLLYYPNTIPEVVEIMEQVADRNEPALTYDAATHGGLDDYSIDMWGVPDYESALDFVVEHPNVTYAVVGFNTAFSFSIGDQYGWVNTTENNTLAEQIDYEIWFNSSLKQIPVPCNEFEFINRETSSNEGIVIIQRLVDQAILSVRSVANGGPSITITPSSRPYIEGLDLGSPEQLASTLGVTFFTAALLINFIITAVTITNEKELKLRMGMRMMGLKDSVFWLTWFLRESFILFLAVILLIVFGYIFQFAFFARTNFFVLFFLFYLFGLSMIPFAFLVTVVVSRVLYALVIAIPVVILSVFLALLAAVLQFLFLKTVHIGYRWIFYWFPPFHFILAYEGIAPATFSTYDFATDSMIPGEGFQWADLYETPFEYRGVEDFRLPYPAEHLNVMLVLFFVYSVLVWYLDAVLPGETSPRPLYFPFQPSYWGFKAQSTHDVATLEIDESWDSDVVTEAQRVKSGETSSKGGLLVAGLIKHYTKLFGGRVTKAVKGITFYAEFGQVFALLGHNGAGKSTAIGVMTGLLDPTGGDVSVFGYSVRTDIDEVRRMLGVCPQHDILWAELTAKEHLELFAEFKGVPASLIQETVMDKLRHVKLDQVANKKSGEFSGGMKRRLSVSIASIGGPKFICLDEPTTGMDPVNRAHVWRMIEELKGDKVVLLTTHSMEEADTLGDRIGIMNEGVLACIGTPLHLKSKFGGGYRLTLITDIKNIPQVKKRVGELVPGVTLADEVASSLHFELPVGTTALPALFEWIEGNTGSANDTSLIRDFGISQTTLEDVFLRLTNREAARAADNEGSGSYESDNEN